MTSEQHQGAGRLTEVQRARAEVVAALTELEDKINIPRRIRRFKQRAPEKFYAAAAGAATVAAGVVALGILVIKRR
jgi:hypothetical protein